MPVANPSLIYVPAPATYGSRQQAKTPLLRADVSGTVQLLANRPFFAGQQAISGQSVTSGADTQIQLDTEIDDPYNGHLDTVNPARYYGMVPGWYLAESVVPVNYTGGAGAITSGIALSVAGGAASYYYGQRLPLSATVGALSTPVCAKLIRLANTGTYGGAGNDFCAAAVNQNSGAAQFSGLPCTLRVSWIAALSGTTGLRVPSNDPWPQPPAGYITSGFLNKNIRDTCRFLLYPPIVEAYNLGRPSNITSATGFPLVGQLIPCDTTTVDTYGGFSPVTSAYTIPAGCGGLYYAYGQAGMTMDANAIGVAAGLTVTSPNYNSGAPVTLWGGAQSPFSSGGFDNAAVIKRRLRLLPGDTVSLAGFQRNTAVNSASINLGGGGLAVTRLILIWQAA